MLEHSLLLWRRLFLLDRSSCFSLDWIWVWKYSRRVMISWIQKLSWENTYWMIRRTQLDCYFLIWTSLILTLPLIMTWIRVNIKDSWRMSLMKINSIITKKLVVWFNILDWDILRTAFLFESICPRHVLKRRNPYSLLLACQGKTSNTLWLVNKMTSIRSMKIT